MGEERQPSPDDQARWEAAKPGELADAFEPEEDNKDKPEGDEQEDADAA